MKKIYLLLICLIFFNCDPIDKRLKIINNSNDSLVAKIVFNNELPNNNYSNRDDVFLLLPRKINQIVILNSWDESFKEAKDSKLNIFITKYCPYEDNKRIWDSIYINKRFVRNTYSLDDLKKMNWEINLNNSLTLDSTQIFSVPTK